MGRQVEKDYKALLDACPFQSHEAVNYERKAKVDCKGFVRLTICTRVKGEIDQSRMLFVAMQLSCEPSPHPKQ